MSSETEITKAEDAAEISPKSRLCAMLLGIFLGEFGVHNFYMGRTGRAALQLLMTIFGFIFYIGGFITLSNSSIGINTMAMVILGFILIFAVSIWKLVEWIIIACGKAVDGQGKMVTNWINQD